QRFGRVADVIDFKNSAVSGAEMFGDPSIQNTCHHVTGAEGNVEQQLGGGARHADSTADNEPEEQPIKGAIVSAGDEGQHAQENAVDQAHGENGPFHLRWSESSHVEHDESKSDISTEVGPEETAGIFDRDLQRTGSLADQPWEPLEQKGNAGSLDGQDNMAFHDFDAPQNLSGLGRRNF